jgi:hypothetical protein
MLDPRLTTGKIIPSFVLLYFFGSELLYFPSSQAPSSAIPTGGIQIIFLFCPCFQFPSVATIGYLFFALVFTNSMTIHRERDTEREIFCVPVLEGSQGKP